MQNTFNEGVRPGGLTSSTEIRILLCYLLDSIEHPVSRQQIEEVLLGEELVNYFVLAEGLGQLLQQKLVAEKDGLFFITDAGRTVGRDLAKDIPKTVREAAVRGVIRAQHYAAKAAVNNSTIQKTGQGYQVLCSIGDAKGKLFGLELYMPDELTAQTVRQSFIEGGDEVYKLVLAALTGDTQLAAKTITSLQAEKKK